MKKLILFLILNILNPTIGNSSEFNHLKFSKETFRVAVIVSCEDKNLKEYIESHIKRELRAIGDVVIVLDKPQTTINIVAIKNKIENIDIGYSMAVTIVKTVDLSFLNNFYKPISETVSEMTPYVFADTLQAFETMYILSGPVSELPSQCSELIASFDLEVLETTRQSKQLFNDLLDQTKPTFNHQSQE